MFAWIRSFFGSHSIRSVGREVVRYTDEHGRSVGVVVTRHSSDTAVLWVDDVDLKTWDHPPGKPIDTEDRNLVVQRVIARIGRRARRISEFPGDYKAEFNRLRQFNDAISEKFR